MNNRQRVIDTIAEVTGLPERELAPDALLEAELGLDSIKTVGLWNNLFDLLPAEHVEAFAQANPPQDLARFQTLGELVQFFAAALDRLAAPADAAPPAAPCAAEVAAPAQAGELPLVPAQQLFLVTHQLIESTGLCTSVRIKGPLKLERVRQAWQALVDRHLNLRTVFQAPADARSFSQFAYTLLAEPRVPEVACLDLSAMPPQDRERAVDDEFERLLNRTWDLAAWPLHSISAARLSPTEHVVYLANEHIVSDGLSNQLLMREFLALYHAAEGGAALPAPMSPQRYRESVDRVRAHAEPREAQAYERHARTSGRETFYWNPGGKPRAYLAPSFRNRKLALSEADTQALQSLAAQWNVSLYALLLGSFVDAAAAIQGGEGGLPVQLPTSGNLYPGVDFDGVAGCFAQVLSLRFDAGERLDATRARDFHARIEGALLDGLDREATRRLAGSMGRDFVLKQGRIPEYLLGQIRRSAVKSNLYFPFTGQTRIAQHYGELEVADYRAGTSNVAGTFDLLQEIHAGRLHLFLNWDELAHDEATAVALLDGYARRLQALAARAAEALPAALPARADPVDAQALHEVVELANAVLATPVTPASVELDLESRLGVDSLERVRLCMRVAQAWQLQPQSLLGCRTLAALAAMRVPPSATVSPAAVSSGAPAAPCAAEGEVQVLDAGLAPMPYLHIVEQARRTPDLVAVCSATASLTYRELDERSNQLARHLRGQGVVRGDLVALICERGPLMLVGLLGILKAGAAYVPVDPSYPAQRMQYIVGHAQARHLVFEAAAIDVAAQLPAATHGEVVLVALDEAPPALPRVHGPALWQAESAAPLAPVSLPDDLMVVLYTSGSTGQPKGVALGHRGYMNRLQWHHEVFRLAVGGRVAQKTSCCFDISVWELLWPLMVGGTVVAVARELVRDPWAFATWLRDESIQVAHFVPSMFAEFVQALPEQPEPFQDLRWLIFSGEALAVPPVQQWFDRFGDRVGLANLYGPTEASIDVTCHIVRERPEDLRIPIGAPIDATQLVVVDPEGNALPVGEMGELCIGGVQLAQGYLHDPVRTEAAFVPNRHAHVRSARLYRTGDLAVELPNGEFDYRGRIDGQVKIRGFRVELGEIEAVLEAHPAVREAAVLALPVRGHLKLVAWVALADQGVDDEALRGALRQRLPDYMIPHQFLHEAALPKNHNGKLDRGCLRQRFEAGQAEAPAAAAPAAAAPAAVPPAVRHAAPAARADEGPAAPRAVAAQQLRQGLAPLAAAPATEPWDDLPLAPAQKWVSHYYPEPFAWWGYSRLRLCDAFAVDAFIDAMNAVIAAHPALRTTFARDERGWRRRVHHAVESFEPSFFDGRGMTRAQLDPWLRAAIVEAAELLRVDRWPLVKAIVVALGEREWEIVFVTHHLIGDMVAGNVMFRALWKHYDDRVAGRAIAARPVPGTETLVRALEAQGSEQTRRQLDYWQRSFPLGQAAFHLPYDELGGANTEDSAALLEFGLSKGTSQALLSTTKNRFDCPLYALLVAPLYRALGAVSGRSRVVVSHRVHGRDALPQRVFIDSIDNFAVNYPLALHVEHGAPLAELVERFRVAQEAVPLRGVSYDWLAEQLPQYLYPDDRLTSVRVNYLGNLDLPPNPRFVIDPEDNNQRLAPPGQRRSCMVEVWLSVSGGALQLRIGYSRNFHAEPTLRRLAETYLGLLEQLVVESAQPA